MESVEMALKNCNMTGDDFSVDDLLDFSNDDVFVDEEEAELKMQRNKGVPGSLNDDNTLHLNNDFSAAGEEDVGSLPASELAVPMDDLAELEWLSNFVDDSSFTLGSAPPSKNKPVWLTGNRSHPVQPPVTDKPPLPVQIRSKRARAGVKVWSYLLTDSSSSSSSTSSDTSIPQFLSGAEFLDDPRVKTKKKKKMKKSLEVWKNSDQRQTQPRRCCTHCGALQTPQWRTGPEGAKSLCNACGVRYKSGRLLPEYRPACSPSFSSELHSNSHRKVVEMRQKKEMSGQSADESGLSQPVETVKVVPSF